MLELKLNRGSKGAPGIYTTYRKPCVEFLKISAWI